MAWEEFSEDFKVDADRYLNWLGGGTLLDDSAPLRSCRPTTLVTRRKHIQLLASAAVRGGVELAALNGLADLVQPGVARAALETYLQENGGRNSDYIADLAACLVSISKHWVKLDPVLLSQLERYSRKLSQHRTTGLTSKNMALIRQVMDPSVRRRLQGLPQKLFREAQRENSSLHKAAVKAQMAVALEILLLAPMRVGNLCALSLTEHMTRPGGPEGPMHIAIPEDIVKNRVPLEFPLPRDTSDLIANYVRHFRHLLKGSESDWLFPGERGHKQPRTMSQQLSKVIYNEVGILMTPHQARHAAAAWLLESDPGNYEIVRRLLAHKSLATTTRFYVGLESVSAAKQYADLITRQREENE